MKPMMSMFKKGDGDFIHDGKQAPVQQHNASTGKKSPLSAKLKGRLVKRNYTPIKSHPVQGLNNFNPSQRPGSSGGDTYLS